ncbi:hypothetical protein L596_002307 [Steinernema carpocapsae]|uniref:G-protein coupled receptors family 1 profile domain-containing protein n=1 Tax=Steinernema carpocapsae TaxID=34508 RepID=A0A4U8UP78_STECR|nr:hypothetical protein L596_002307 [Steinernema carpocapsae]
MNAFLFDPKFASTYNCSAYLAKVAVPPLEIREVFIGLVYIILGIIYEVAYIPCFIAMIMTPALRRHSCYKIMIALAMVDIMVIPINAILSGVFLLLGISYCNCPTLVYVVGCAALALWTGACALCSILALNRCTDLLCNNFHKKIFNGSKIYLWLLFVFLYMAYFFFFTNPLLFSALYSAWFFDPFVGISDQPDVGFDNMPHLVNNITAVVILVVLDSTLFLRIIRKIPIAKERVGHIRTQVTLQVALIGTLAIVAAVIYIIMQYISTPYSVIVVGQLAWQAGHGAASFVYFGMNNSIRRAIKRVFWDIIPPKNRAVVATVSRHT